MTNKWSPSDIQRVMAVSSACSCMVILVGGVSIGVVIGKISPEVLGSAKGLGVGGGLVGLAMLLYLMIKTALNPDSRGDGGDGGS